VLKGPVCLPARPSARPFADCSPALWALWPCSDCVPALRAQVKPGKKAKFQLGVADPKLGSEIQDQTAAPCVCNEFTGEVIRGIRFHAPRLLKQLEEQDMARAQLGLAHSYSRAKVRMDRRGGGQAGW
jgi:RNA processing factor Prp31